MSDWIYLGDVAPLPTDFSALIMALLLAFLCGQLLAWVYMYTHSGLSYSRTYVSSLILIPITVALVMMVLDNNLVTAFSLMAVFAIVRFRNIVRDTLDTVYILSLIVIGMACGTQKFSTALIGTLIASSVLIYIWFTSFGSRQRYDLILNLHWSESLKKLSELQQLLERHSLKVHMASQRSVRDDEGADLSYRLLLRDPSRIQDLLNELQANTAVSRVTTMKAEEESEV
ncbi:DUF4956 domain-containing protein [Natronogracilivirga saccharolytica]|uniref:DUF4956 domain-containing protein n=1 Tax=Natronogracilivirga saccharolytica TaxID=2812953 RepID=A0A8J7RKE3_9BACT|nr:DUF4956 domain-containing protein [Natronogracilivirga saccharolytica]MBP3192862.1 DUF4956 domain-containing protein [Natronogracilivirga saccharolytica]